MKINFKILLSLLSIFCFLFFSIISASASETNGTIVTGGNSGYAWSDQAGWVNFGCANCGIQITDSGITGYAWNSNYGWINMSPTSGGVSVAASGALSGSAWGSGVGWINFSGVSMNSSGRFVGQAAGDIIGTLTFDCANCSVTTDFMAQNFRTVVSTPTTAVSGGGGGVGTIANIPPHMTSYNFPLSVLPIQTGFLEQTVSQNRKATIDVPRNIFPKKITITIGENPLVGGVNSALLPQNTDLINSAFYDVVAKDESNNLVKSFFDYITITLPIPFESRSFSDTGVYWLNETASRWERVPDVVFSESNATASFRVNHLTKFGIFRAVEGLKDQFPIPFALEIIREMTEGKTFEEAVSEALETIEEVAAPASAEVVEGEAALPEEVVPKELLPAQLFDINLEIENSKIADIKNLVARVLFTSFGRVPTPVDLTFDILNETGEKVYSKKDKITVRTQEVLTERFANIDKILKAGNYTLLVTTLYNVSVTDEFRQNFEIVSPEEAKAPFWKSVWFWIATTILWVLMFIIVFKKIGGKEKREA